MEKDDTVPERPFIETGRGGAHHDPLRDALGKERVEAEDDPSQCLERDLFERRQACSFVMSLFYVWREGRRAMSSPNLSFNFLERTAKSSISLVHDFGFSAGRIG